MMLDKPAQTARLVEVLKAAVPFDVELLPSTLERFKANDPAREINATETVFQVTYEPRHGGIICLIRPSGTDDLVATSLTHVRVHRTKAFAAAVADYQKHRLKKLRRKQAQRMS